MGKSKSMYFSADALEALNEVRDKLEDCGLIMNESYTIKIALMYTLRQMREKGTLIIFDKENNNE